MLLGEGICRRGTSSQKAPGSFSLLRLSALNAWSDFQPSHDHLTSTYFTKRGEFSRTVSMSRLPLSYPGGLPHRLLGHASDTCISLVDKKTPLSKVTEMEGANGQGQCFLMKSDFLSRIFSSVTFPLLFF